MLRCGRRDLGVMSQPEVKIDTVRSYSGGLPGRALNQARTNHFVIDSPSGPHEALSSGEAFLAGVSSCGVTLIELYALHGLTIVHADLYRLRDPAELDTLGLRDWAQPGAISPSRVRMATG